MPDRIVRGCLGLTVAVSVTVGAVTVGGAPSDAQTSEAPVAATVSLKSFRFSPASVTVREGGTITWTYDETATDVPPGCESPVFQLPGAACPGHSTTATDRGPDGALRWDSGVRRAPGYPYRVRFDRPGTYRYVCTVHTGGPLGPMTGEVVVVAARAPVPAPAPPSTARPAGPVPTLPARPTPTALPRPSGPGASTASATTATTGAETSGAWIIALLMGAGLVARRRARRAG